METRTLRRYASDSMQADWNRLAAEAQEVASAILASPEGRGDVSLAPEHPGAPRVLCGFRRRPDGSLDAMIAHHGEEGNVIDAGAPDEIAAVCAIGVWLRRERQAYATGQRERVEAPSHPAAKGERRNGPDDVPVKLQTDAPAPETPPAPALPPRDAVLADSLAETAQQLERAAAVIENMLGALDVLRAEHQAFEKRVKDAFGELWHRLDMIAAALESKAQVEAQAKPKKQ